MKKENQNTLFGDEDPENEWEKEWKNMPEFSMKKLTPLRTINLNFLTKEDIEAFEKLIGQKLTPSYNTYWFPKLNIKTYSDKAYFDKKDES